MRNSVAVRSHDVKYRSLKVEARRYGIHVESLLQEKIHGLNLIVEAGVHQCLLHRVTGRDIFRKRVKDATKHWRFRIQASVVIKEFLQQINPAQSGCEARINRGSVAGKQLGDLGKTESRRECHGASRTIAAVQSRSAIN